MIILTLGRFADHQPPTGTSDPFSSEIAKKRGFWKNGDFEKKRDFLEFLDFLQFLKISAKRQKPKKKQKAKTFAQGKKMKKRRVGKKRKEKEKRRTGIPDFGTRVEMGIVPRHAPGRGGNGRGSRSWLRMGRKGGRRGNGAGMAPRMGRMVPGPVLPPHPPFPSPPRSGLWFFPWNSPARRELSA